MKKPELSPLNISTAIPLSLPLLVILTGLLLIVDQHGKDCLSAVDLAKAEDIVRAVAYLGATQ